MASFQYIGDGHGSPESINFMGQVKFKLKGAYVEVTDPQVLAKIQNHRCFREKGTAKKGAPKKAVKKVVAKKAKA